MSGRRRLILGLFVAVALVTAAFGLWPAQIEPAPSYKTVDCWFGAKAVHGVSCGKLVVPQDWNAPDARSFRLPVLRVHAKNDRSDAPPVVFLSGGPGDTSYISTRDEALHWKNWASTWFDDRDLIVIEPRGSYKSEPSLMCPKLNDPIVWAGLSAMGEKPSDPMARFAKLENACRKRLSASGIALQAVNRHQIAKDVKELANQLELSKVSLYGISYGTTYAMTVMNDYPDLISSVILDSVFPPETTKTINGHMAMRRTIARYSAACRRNTLCKTKGDSFRSTFIRVIRTLNAEPVDVAVKVPGRAEKFTSRVDALRFLSAMRTLMLASDWLTYVPHIVYSIDDGKKEFLQLIVENELRTGHRTNHSYGVISTAGCYDFPVNFTKTHAAKLLKASTDLKKLELQFLNVFYCAQQSSARAPADSRQRLVSSVPTLILAGEFDPATPPYLAQMAARGLTHAHTFVFPFGSHGLGFTNSCAGELIWDFLKSPLKRPERSCFNLEPKPSFLFSGG